MFLQLGRPIQRLCLLKGIAYPHDWRAWAQMFFVTLERLAARTSLFLFAGNSDWILLFELTQVGFMESEKSLISSWLRDSGEKIAYLQRGDDHPSD